MIAFLALVLRFVAASPDYQLVNLILMGVYVCLTLVVAVGAICSVFITRAALKASEKQSKAAIDAVQEMRIAREEENAPFVVVYFKYIHSRSTIYLIVENIGKSVAKKVKMKFAPPLQGSKFMQRELKNNILLTDGISSIVPNYKIPIPFDYLNHYFDENLPLEYKVSVTYYGSGALPQQEVKYVLDLKPYKYTHFVTEKGLDEIDETLQRLESHFRNYSMIAESANSLLNQIANSINKGLVIKNHVSVSQNNADIPRMLKEFELLWVVDYGKQKEKWNKSFIFGLRAKCLLISEELLKGAVTLDSQEWAEQLKHVIGNMSRLGSMELVLDAPEGVMITSPHFLGGSSREDFNNLGDSIVTDIRTVVEMVEKEKANPLNGDNKEEAQLPTSIEEGD